MSQLSLLYAYVSLLCLVIKLLHYPSLCNSVTIIKAVITYSIKLPIEKEDSVELALRVALCYDIAIENRSFSPCCKVRTKIYIRVTGAK